MKYDLHVSLQPEFTDGAWRHYWHITQTNDDGVFTVAHGYAVNYGDVIIQATKAKNNLGI